MLLFYYPDVQPLYPHSIQMWHPSVKTSVFLQVGHNFSSISGSATTRFSCGISCGGVTLSASLICFRMYGFFMLFVM